MKRLVIPLLFAAVAVGCTDDVLAPPTEGPLLSRAGGAGCRAVEFEAALLLPPPPAPGAGTVTGDLVGDILQVFPPTGVWHGKIFQNDGTDFITVTSETIPGLPEGTIVEHQHKNLAVGAPGLGALALLSGHGKIVAPAGVSGHLNFHGTFDISSFPFAVDLTYRGNICVP